VIRELGAERKKSRARARGLHQPPQVLVAKNDKGGPRAMERRNPYRIKTCLLERGTPRHSTRPRILITRRQHCKHRPPPPMRQRPASSCPQRWHDVSTWGAHVSKGQRVRVDAARDADATSASCTRGILSSPTFLLRRVFQEIPQRASRLRPGHAWQPRVRRPSPFAGCAPATWLP